MFDAFIEEARRTGPDQWIDHEELGRRLAFTAEERAAAQARLERRRREDAEEEPGERRSVDITADKSDTWRMLRDVAAATAGTGVVALLTFRMYRDLVQQTGSDQAAQRFLRELATEVGRPVAVNVLAEGGSHTVFIPPSGWTEEKLRGFVGGAHRAALAAFDPITGRSLGLHEVSGPASPRTAAPDGSEQAETEDVDSAATRHPGAVKAKPK